MRTGTIMTGGSTTFHFRPENMPRIPRPAHGGPRLPDTPQGARASRTDALRVASPTCAPPGARTRIRWSSARWAGVRPVSAPAGLSRAERDGAGHNAFTFGVSCYHSTRLPVSSCGDCLPGRAPSRASQGAGRGVATVPLITLWKIQDRRSRGAGEEIVADLRDASHRRGRTAVSRRVCPPPPCPGAISPPAAVIGGPSVATPGPDGGSGDAARVPEAVRRPRDRRRRSPPPTGSFPVAGRRAVTRGPGRRTAGPSEHRRRTRGCQVAPGAWPGPRRRWRRGDLDEPETELVDGVAEQRHDGLRQCWTGVVAQAVAWIRGRDPKWQSHSDDVPLRPGPSARGMQSGSQQRGESGSAQRPGVRQRESVLRPEVIGDGQEVVVGLRWRRTVSTGDSAPSDRSEWVCRLPRQKRPGRLKGRPITCIPRQPCALRVRRRLQGWHGMAAAVTRN